MASDLQINLEKSKIFSVGVGWEEVLRGASRLGCVVATLPFTYLGSSVGSNMSCITNWDPVVEKLEVFKVEGEHIIFQWLINANKLGAWKLAPISLLRNKFFGEIPGRVENQSGLR